MTTQTIRRRLLSDQILLILLLGAAILATTFLGARRAVETLSRGIVERAADQAESELRRFFDPVAGRLQALRAWGDTGQLAHDDPRGMRGLLGPLAEGLPQISGVLVADDGGREHFLTRGGSDGAWRSRLTEAGEEQGRVRWLAWGAGGGEPEEFREESSYDPRSRPWFEGAAERRSAGPGGTAAIHWTEPYEFFTARRPGITAAPR